MVSFFHLWFAAARKCPLERAERFDKRVMFEPVSTHHIASTYAMDWSLFEAITTAVRGAQA